MTKIDTEIWITQASMAAIAGVTVQCVNNWITRKKIKAMIVPGSRLVLVNKLSAPIVNTRAKTV